MRTASFNTMQAAKGESSSRGAPNVRFVPRGRETFGSRVVRFQGTVARPLRNVSMIRISSALVNGCQPCGFIGRPYSNVKFAGGFVTQFQFDVVPEPSTGWLLLTGTFVFLRFRKAR